MPDEPSGVVAVLAAGLIALLAWCGFGYGVVRVIRGWRP